MINNINKTQSYLGTSWILSIFNIIFLIPVAAVLIAFTFSSHGFPLEFMFENWGLSAYICISFISSIIFILKSKSFESHNFKSTFMYSLLPNISMTLFVLFILFISSKPVVMAISSH